MNLPVQDLVLYMLEVDQFVRGGALDMIDHPWITVSSSARQSLHCALAAAQCILIGHVCLFVVGWVGGCVCVCVRGCICYHDNSKLRASIFTKLGL